MKINIKAFRKVVKEVQQNQGISNNKLSEIMELDYSYIFRILKENSNYGIKMINGMEKFCKYFDIDSKEFIFLE